MTREQSPVAVFFNTTRVACLAPHEDLAGLELLYLEGTVIALEAHRPSQCFVC